MDAEHFSLRQGCAPCALAFLALCTVTGSLAPGRPARSAEPASPIAYCARVGSDDTVQPLPRSLLPAAEKAFGLRLPEDMGEQGVSWRCADGKVLACFTGANLPCGKADTSTKSEAADAWCRAHPGAGIPLVVVGHDTVWRWRCDGQAAVRDGAAWQVDPRGFVSGLWLPLNGPA